MLSKKDYHVIAEIIKEAGHTLSTTCATHHEARVYMRQEIARELADYFVAENGMFDRDEFIVTCGAEPDEPSKATQAINKMVGMSADGVLTV